MDVVLCANVGIPPYDRTAGLEKTCVVFTYNLCNIMIEHLVLEKKKKSVVFTYNPYEFFLCMIMGMG
jgi:hypothetical protein